MITDPFGTVVEDTQTDPFGEVVPSTPTFEKIKKPSGPTPGYNTSITRLIKPQVKPSIVTRPTPKPSAIYRPTEIGLPSPGTRRVALEPLKYEPSTPQEYMEAGAAGLLNATGLGGLLTEGNYAARKHPVVTGASEMIASIPTFGMLNKMTSGIKLLQAAKNAGLAEKVAKSAIRGAAEMGVYSGAGEAIQNKPLEEKLKGTALNVGFGGVIGAGSELLPAFFSALGKIKSGKTVTPKEVGAVGEVVKNKSMLEDLRKQGHITEDDGIALQKWLYEHQIEKPKELQPSVIQLPATMPETPLRTALKETVEMTPSSMINAITLKEAGDRVVAGDTSVLPHIQEAVEKFGPATIQDNLVNKGIGPALARQAETAGGGPIGFLKAEQGLKKIQPGLHTVLAGGKVPGKVPLTIPKPKLTTKQIYDEGFAKVTSDLNDNARTILNNTVKTIDQDLISAGGTGRRGANEIGESYGIKSARPNDLVSQPVAPGKNSAIKWSIARERLENGYNHPLVGEIPPDIEFLVETGQIDKARQLFESPKVLEIVGLPTKEEYNFNKDIVNLADSGGFSKDLPEVKTAREVVKRYETVREKLYPNTSPENALINETTPTTLPETANAQPVLQEAAGPEYLAEQSAIAERQARQSAIEARRQALSNKRQISPLLESRNPLLAGTSGMQPELLRPVRQGQAFRTLSITGKDPDIMVTKPMVAKDVAGNKIELPPDSYTPYKLNTGNILLKDGEQFMVRPNQYQNIKGQSKPIEGKEFAPELKQTEETVKGEKTTPISFEKWNENRKSWGKQLGTLEEYNKDIHQITTRETKFSQYTLPGGSNYREILIKAPLEAKGNYDALELTYEKKYGKDWNAKITEEERQRFFDLDWKKEPKLSTRTDIFKGGHWDEPNVIAHLRMNDRVTPDGKPVLFIEESQSDWALKARKEGIKPKTIEEYFEPGKIVPSYGGFDKVIAFHPATETKGWSVDVIATNQNGVIEKGAKVRNHATSPMLKNNLVPDHPLLKNWQELSLKRALKEAVDGNYDYLAWVSGKQTADRYNLAKVVDEIKWVKLPNKDVYMLDVFKDGQSISKKINLPVDIKATEIEQYIGKEPAQKILNSKGYEGILKNPDLMVVGDWATSLYDRQIPNILKDLTGEKAETLQIKVPNKYDVEGYSTQQAIKITPEIRAMVKGEAVGKKPSGGVPVLPNRMTTSMPGVIAGIEPETDEQGKPTGKVKFNPTKAALGIGAMGLMGGLKFKGKQPILSEVEQILSPKVEAKIPIRQAISGAIKQFETNLISRFTPLRSAETELYKAVGMKAPEHNLARKFELVAGAAGKAENDILGFEEAVTKPVGKLTNELNQYLFLKRTQDRLIQDPETRRVGTWTVEKTTQGLNELKAKVGDDAFKNIETIANGAYQQEMDKALRLQVDSGRMSEGTYKVIKESNDFYAPFKVMRYLDDYMAGTGKKISGTVDLTKAIKGISSEDFKLGDILNESQKQIFKARILAEKNLKMLELDNVAKLDTTGKLIRPIAEDAKVPEGYKVVTYFKNGEKQRLAVTPELAKAVDGLNPGETGLIAKVLISSASPMRWGATGANLGFQAVNILADSTRTALISKYGIRGTSDIIKFPADWLASFYASMTGNFGAKNTLYREFLASGAANSTIQRGLTADVFTRSFEKQPLLQKLNIGKTILTSVEKFTNALEETAKVLTLKRGLRFENIKDLAKTNPELAAKKIAEIATEARNFGGSPDFLRRGDITKDLNILFMFFNARLQGAATDVARLTGRTGGKEAVSAWTRLSLAIGLPTTALTLYNLAPENREDYDKLTPTDKENYWHIPRNKYYTNDTTGEKIREYWRIPKRETMQLFANLIEQGIQYAYDKDPQAGIKMAGSLLENISPINIEGKNLSERAESVIASTNPAAKIPVEFAAGRNMRFHSDTVPFSMQKASPKEQYRLTTPEIYKKIGSTIGISPLQIQQAIDSATGGFAGQFAINKPKEGRSIFTELPIAKRFVRGKQVYNPEEDVLKQTLQQQVDVKLNQNRKAKELIDLNKTNPEEAARQFNAIPSNEKKAIYTKIVELQKNEQLGLTYRDILTKQLQIENGERARYIYDTAMKMTPEERADYAGALIKKKIMTKEVVRQIYLLQQVRQ